ncbi:MAG: GNAT family N-acetyltransferase [Chloroflexi bacterium]|nr:GNAT family N-acetyltransferase [Chloroflexota bacterium]
MTQVETPPRSREPLPLTVRKAVTADIPALTATLARAFDDDPFINWMAAQDKHRARRVYDAMALGVKRLTFPHDEVYTADGTPGGACWTPPGKWKLGLLQQLMLVPSMVKTTTWRRIPTVMNGMNAVEKKHPHEPHYYLLALGTEPDLQGRGVGTQLMRPILERCDRERIPAYLESSKERNVPLYERNGFRVTEVFTVPGGGPPIWLMWRDPQ